jgi:hypothetical protein
MEEMGRFRTALARREASASSILVSPRLALSMPIEPSSKKRAGPRPLTGEICIMLPFSWSRATALFTLCLGVTEALGGSTPQPAPAAVPGALLHADDFSGDLSAWEVEQQPDGKVYLEDGKLIIEDAGGCTVWFRQKLQAPVIISYEATVSSRARVSDLNCFWMATDPARPRDLLAPGHQRTGQFATYDGLRTYYVGYGGNNNTTTRFRRYTGDGARPLAPEHDLGQPPFLLKPDHTYRIQLIAADGKAQFIRDGQVIFELQDPEPLTEGWFGFRTVRSRLELANFRVHQAVAP